VQLASICCGPLVKRTAFIIAPNCDNFTFPAIAGNWMSFAASV
jgi:hypothetical protein